MSLNPREVGAIVNQAQAAGWRWRAAKHNRGFFLYPPTGEAILICATRDPRGGRNTKALLRAAGLDVK